MPSKWRMRRLQVSDMNASFFVVVFKSGVGWGEKVTLKKKKRERKKAYCPVVIGLYIYMYVKQNEEIWNQPTLAD